MDGRQHFGRAALERPVGDSWHTKWSLFRLAGLGDIDPPNIRRSISLAVNGLEHRLYPSIEALFRRLHRLSVHSCGRPLRNLQQILPHPIARDVMSQRREAEFRFASSFRCYLFKFRFHGQLIFSLNRRPCPVEWSPCCPRTIHLPLTASPCGRLSRPRSTISQYDFHSVVRPPSPCRLVGPYKLSFEPNGSPVFTLIPLVACWRYEPREHRLATRTLSRPAIPPSPLRDRVGYSDHDRFRGYFPVHFIPAYNLPVYASQWLLPDTTQDSVRGCSLGSTAAAISGDRVQRTCTAQPARIRTCTLMHTALTSGV